MWKLKELLYNIKWGLWALRKYFRVVWSMRPWDYGYLVKMTRHQLGLLAHSLENQDILDKDEAIVQIRRCIELIDHYIENDHHERCGYDSNWNSYTKPIPGRDGVYEVHNTMTPKQQEDNWRAIKEGLELKRKEIEEIKSLLFNIENWWW